MASTSEHCNRCGGTREHEVLYIKKIPWSQQIDDRYEICGEDTYELLRCSGCKEVQFRHSHWFSEDEDPQGGGPNVHVEHYPPRTFRKKPKWLYPDKKTGLFGLFSMPIHTKIEPLLTEIYIALQNNTPQIALLGSRALLEIVMTDKVGDQGNLANNLKAFLNGGYISARQKEILESVLNIGSAAMHRGYTGDEQMVSITMDIIESIIESTYVDERRARAISKETPLRKTK